ncbi:MAG: glutamine--fructose-6-phosphate transaminase (isomerizing) [Pseudomonadota bacterium]
MCGIIGILGDKDIVPDLLESLRRLEYRGYDSAGVAVIGANGKVDRRRAAGKLANLDAALKADPISGHSGIGHTRWATHGAATENNAHPHQSQPVTLVHNGIIENFRALRAELEADFAFETETDTETVAHLIAAGLKGKTGADAAKAAFSAALARLTGAFALAVLVEGEDDLMLGARRGSPLVIGVGDGAMYLGSDALAVAPFTDRVVYLEEDDWCAITRDGYEIFDKTGASVRRPETVVQAMGSSVEKGNYRHFMQKEIFEQPEATARTIGAYLNGLTREVSLPGNAGEALDLASVTNVQMVACGTAYYACAVAEYWFEQIARIPVSIDIASEFRYREPVLSPGGLALFVSQSGETADTLAALKYCKAGGMKTAAVVNVPTSTIAREVDAVLPTLAGTEVGVASTKAFTAQLCALAATAIALGRAKGTLTAEDEQRLSGALNELPRLMASTLQLDRPIEKLARELVKARDVLYLGRGQQFPIAMEGALKLKEISYIHAEGYAAGELKHGPIALVDDETPVIFVAPHDRLFEKSISNLEEVVARRGRVILVTDTAGAKAAGDSAAHVIQTPDVDPFISPMITAIPVQLLAYHIAVEKGTDVDQPRNLAKSVTVE